MKFSCASQITIDIDTFGIWYFRPITLRSHPKESLLLFFDFKGILKSCRVNACKVGWTFLHMGPTSFQVIGEVLRIYLMGFSHERTSLPLYCFKPNHMCKKLHISSFLSYARSFVLWHPIFRGPEKLSSYFSVIGEIYEYNDQDLAPRRGLAPPVLILQTSPLCNIFTKILIFFTNRCQPSHKGLIFGRILV